MTLTCDWCNDNVSTCDNCHGKFHSGDQIICDTSGFNHYCCDDCYDNDHEKIESIVESDSDE